MTKDSKAQTEVWLWKARLSEELNSIPEGKRLDWIKKKTASAVAKLKIKRAKREAVTRLSLSCLSPAIVLRPALLWVTIGISLQRSGRGFVFRAPAAQMRIAFEHH